MGILIVKDDPKPETDYKISQYDAELIENIKKRLGPIAAMRVVRWATGCSLLDAKRFVEGVKC